MGSVNRYTNIQAAKYTPRTLQELMMVPQYKREQHTGIEDQIAATETALAQMDPLDIHSERARMEQQKLYDQMTQQAETLGREGFTQTSKSDFGRLNKQYQQAISPTGDLGKMQIAKKAYEAEKAAGVKNMITAGYSPSDAEAKWKSHSKEYKDKFIVDGEVSNIGGLYAPNYKNAVTEFRAMAKELEVDTEDLGDLTSNIVRSPDGSSYVLNEGWEDSLSSD